MEITKDIDSYIQRKELIDKELDDFYKNSKQKEKIFDDVFSIEKLLSNDFENRIKYIQNLISEYEQLLNDIQNSALFSHEYDDPDDPYNDKVQITQRIGDVLNNINSTLTSLKNLLEQKDKPLFGSIRYEENDKKFNYYIGKLSVIDKDNFKQYVVDWRSPIANIFYQSDGSEKTIKTIINKKNRDIKIREKKFIDVSLGKVVDIYTPKSGNKDADKYLLSKVKTKKAGKLQDIVNTIQSLQNNIIRSPKDQITVIQGVAGSGKTTILFHKLAYLFFNYPEQFNENNCVIVVPNRLFKDYTTEILVSLGIIDIKLMTFYEILQRFLQLRFPFIINKQDEISLNILDKNYDNIISKIIKKYERDLVTKLIKLPKKYLESFFTQYHKLKIPFSKDKITEAYNNLEINIKIEDVSDFRLEVIYEFLLSKKTEWDEILTERDYRYLKDSDLIKKFNKINEEINYNEVYQDIDFDGLDFNDPKPKIRYIKLNWAELFLLFEIKKHFISTKGYEFDLIAVDEAQNYNFSQIKLLYELTKRNNLVIAGDLAQQIESGIPNWEIFKELNGSINYFEMKTSYRISKEIAEYLAKISTSKYKPNSIISRPSSCIIKQTSNLNELVNSIKKLLKDDDSSHIALITKDLSESEKLYKNLSKNKHIQPYLVKNTLDSGILITYVAAIKGVEFDTVILIDSHKFTENEKYLSATRTLDKLIILEKFHV